MINNKEIIKPLLNFEKEGDFYMLYIFKRKKDFPEMEQKNHQSVRTIKTYCIDSIDYLEKRWDEIVGLCEYFGARAYIHVQKQNHFDVSLSLMVELANRIQNNVHNQKNIFDSVVGQLKTKEKRWVVDLDSKKDYYISTVAEIISQCQPLGDKIISKIPTKNGFHLITNPFNLEIFKDLMEQYDMTCPDIQKRNPTLIFYPNSLD